MGTLVTNGSFFNYETGPLNNFICLNTGLTFNNSFPSGSYNVNSSYLFLYDETDSVTLGNRTNTQNDIQNLLVSFDPYTLNSKYRVKYTISKRGNSSTNVIFLNRYTPTTGTKVIQLFFNDGSTNHLIHQFSYTSTSVPYLLPELGTGHSITGTKPSFEMTFTLGPILQKVYSLDNLSYVVMVQSPFFFYTIKQMTLF